RHSVGLVRKQCPQTVAEGHRRRPDHERQEEQGKREYAEQAEHQPEAGRVAHGLSLFWLPDFSNAACCRMREASSVNGAPQIVYLSGMGTIWPESALKAG